jgi:uncharacterized protein YjbI with pentapeptide repeats
MLKVIINAYHTAINWTPKNVFLLEKIYQTVLANQQKTEINSHLSPIQRFKLAIEQLDRPNQEISLTIFNDLAKIAQDEPKLHGKIIEKLTNFVRKNATNQAQQEVNGKQSLTIRQDIQAALTVIAQRNTQQDLETEQLDLSLTDIRGAKLCGANLAKSNLYRTNLAGADLCGANLHGAILTAANLAGANLAGANLTEAILSAAILSEANLAGADLQRASLNLAKLQGAILDDAILHGANLRDAEFS